MRLARRLRAVAVLVLMGVALAGAAGAFLYSIFQRAQAAAPSATDSSRAASSATS